MIMLGALWGKAGDEMISFNSDSWLRDTSKWDQNILSRLVPSIYLWSDEVVSLDLDITIENFRSKRTKQFRSDSFFKDSSNDH